ncbi:MAG: hypothetical protein IPM74_07410 [Crocinitomicaceae bacterium]|nr:hypothetical protein [Crocinitomicaceae bacterium]MBK8925727.1 hypothetical protein [Crocinitomicaceae bacterium]
MKRILIIILVFISSISQSQFLFESNFNRNATANNQVICMGYQHDKISFGIGLKYLYNKKDNFPYHVAFKRTFWALNLSEHFGANIFFNVDIWKMEKSRFSLFYDFQFTKSSNRFETYYALDELVDEPQSIYDYSYIKYTAYFQPVYGFENNIGLQFQYFLTKNIFLNQKAGIGILFYKEFDPIAIIGNRGWVFSEMLSIGLGWKFTQKTKAK